MGVRIANLRSTNPNSTSALMKETQQKGASFLDMLTSASSQPAQSMRSAVPANFRATSNANQDDATENEQAQGSANDDQDLEGSQSKATVLASSAKQIAALPSLLLMQSRGLTSAVSRTVSSVPSDRPQMSSTALAAKIAATVALPSSQIRNADAAVPAPTQQALADEKRNGSGSPEASSNSTVQARGAQTDRADHAGTEKSQGQDAKPANESAQTNENAGDGSQPAAATPGFTIPGAVCTAVPMDAGVLLPEAANLASAEGNQLANSSTASSGSAQGIANNSDALSANNSAKDSQTTTSSLSADASSQSASSVSQAMQHAQIDIAAPNTADPGAAQIQSISAPAATHDAPAQTRTDGPSSTPRQEHLPASEQQLQAQETDHAASGVNAAKVIQNMSETEMRVGMHSAEFGGISIRTAISQQQMTAQISVDHSDLGKAISAHIPSMQEKIGGETGLRALVEVSQSAMSFTGERGSSPQHQPRTHSSAANVQSVDTTVDSDQTFLSTAPLTTGSSYRLDIRA
jgi:hypothetical protein